MELKARRGRASTARLTGALCVVLVLVSGPPWAEGFLVAKPHLPLASSACFRTHQRQGKAPLARQGRRSGRAEDGAGDASQSTSSETNQKKERALKKNLETLASGLREDIAQFDGTEVARISGTEGTSPVQRSITRSSEGRDKRRTSTLFLVEELTTDDGLTLSGDELLEARTNWVRDLLSTGNSLLLRRIADRLGFVGIWALLVTLFFALSPPEWGVQERISVPAWPHELVGGFLSILLVFRTDQAYQRFWEGRAMWADVAGYVRSMAIIAVTVLDGEQRNVILAHLCVLPVVLKQHLRGMRSGQEVLSVFDLLGVRESWRARGVQSIIAANNMPLTLLTSLSSQLRGANSVGTMSREDLTLFKESISGLAKTLSECEKLRCTPIPLSYSRHTSRFFTLFSLSLPFSLVQDMTPVLVSPVVVFVSWILFATEEIGLIIEEPFGRGLTAPPPPPEAASDEDLEAIFEYFDEDASGFIDKTELFLALDRLGVAVKPGAIEKLVNSVDANGNSLIELSEFRVLYDTCLKKAAAMANSQKDEYRDPYTADGFTVKNLNKVEYTWPGRIFTWLVKGAFDIITAVWAGDQAVEIGTSQLEVLPLDRYVYGIQKDVLQQAAFMAGQTPGQDAQRQRYMVMASRIRTPLSCPDLNTRYRAPWRFQQR